MALPEKLKNVLRHDGFLGFCLLLIFLATNGYIYGWDDQHLEIPLLKSLIDPTLYAGDYYVESLKKNFTSILYPLLAKVLTVEQIPQAYVLLYLFSRYVFFLYVYKFWNLVSKEKVTAFCAALAIIVLGRVEEFLYRTFSHQELALAGIMAGIYYFYKERYFLAAALLGVTANIHGLYSIFPFSYMVFHLLRRWKDGGLDILFKMSGIFAALALPFLIWTLSRRMESPAIDPNWIELYRVACPQNFLFQDNLLSDMLRDIRVFWRGSQFFWPLVAMWFLNQAQNAVFRDDRKTRDALRMAAGWLLFSFVFSYLRPNRFVLDLNLVRNLQFVQFFLMGYTTILMAEKIKTQPWLVSVPAVVFFTCLRFGNGAAGLAAVALFAMFALASTPAEDRRRRLKGIALLILLGFAIAGIVVQFKTTRFSPSALLCLKMSMLGAVITGFLYSWTNNVRGRAVLRAFFLVIPLAALTVNYIYYHYRHAQIEKSGTGFWQLQRNWIDMQNYVRTHTPKNTLLLIPYDMEMGGFRIFSERRVVCCYRDCGIIGFDYAAAVEWRKRVGDIEAFQVFVDKPLGPALMNAILNYKVNHIVFMRYRKPGKNSLLELVYENETFVLYKVLANPVATLK